MERPSYISVEPVVSHVLPDPKRPNAIATAEIKVGPSDRGWLCAISVSAPASGRFEPLGYWSDYPPRRTFPDLNAALAGAIADLRAWLGHDGAEPIRARVLAWLDSLNPAQPDLFGAAP